MPRPRLALAIGLLWLATGAVAHSYLVCANWLGDSDDCATALPFFERTAAPPIQAGTPLNFRHTDAPLVESTPLCEATTEPSFGGDGSSLQTFATGTTPITVEPGASVRIAWPDNNVRALGSLQSADASSIRRSSRRRAFDRSDDWTHTQQQRRRRAELRSHGIGRQPDLRASPAESATLTSQSLLQTEPLVTLPFDGGSCKKNPSGGEWKLKAQTLGWVCSGEVPIASDLAPGRYTFVWSWACVQPRADCADSRTVCTRRSPSRAAFSSTSAAVRRRASPTRRLLRRAAARYLRSRYRLLRPVRPDAALGRPALRFRRWPRARRR